MKKATANLFLDTRKLNANQKYPVKLTIYFRPDKKRYGTGIDLTEEEWQKVNSSRLKSDELRTLKIKLTGIIDKANKVLENLPLFSFASFERVFFNSSPEKKGRSLEAWFNDYIELLDKEDRVGTKTSYNTTLNSLTAFKSNLKLTDITKEFLSEYEAHMLRSGKSMSTIGIYLRNLRAIINAAIKDGDFNRDDYPFHGYKIPASRNIKKALSDEQLKALINYKPKTKAQLLAHDFWLLSYLCNGMNFTDILHLSPKNIDGEFLSFIRQKTKRTKKRDLRPIKMALHPMAKDIIKRWRNPLDSADYLFPFLTTGLAAKTVKNRIQKFIKKVNESMEEIRQELGFENRLGTYVARHSFSTRLMRKGASTQFIKESLGHSTVTTTENYLGDFADNVKSEYSDMLTTF